MVLHWLIVLSVFTCNIHYRHIQPRLDCLPPIVLLEVQVWLVSRLFFGMFRSRVSFSLNELE